MTHFKRRIMTVVELGLAPFPFASSQLRNRSTYLGSITIPTMSTFSYDPSSRGKIKSIVTRALNRPRQSPSHRTNGTVNSKIPLSPQSECGTLVDFDISSDDEDDTVTISGGNERDDNPSWKSLRQPATELRPSQTLRGRSGPFIDRAEMLDPEDRAWDAPPRSNLPSRFRQWPGLSLGKNSNSQNQHARRVQDSPSVHRGMKAEMLDEENRCWV